MIMTLPRPVSRICATGAGASGFHAYRRVLDDLDSAREMAGIATPDLRALAQDELLEVEERRAGRSERWQLLLLRATRMTPERVFWKSAPGRG